MSPTHHAEVMPGVSKPRESGTHLPEKTHVRSASFQAHVVELKARHPRLVNQPYTSNKVSLSRNTHEARL